MVLLEETEKGAQEAAELGTGGLCREGLERPQRADRTAQQRRRRAAAPPAENVSRQTERRTWSSSAAWQERRGRGRRFVLLLEESGKDAQEAAEPGTAAHEKENGNKKALRIDARPKR